MHWPEFNYTEFEAVRGGHAIRVGPGEGLEVEFAPPPQGSFLTRNRRFFGCGRRTGAVPAASSDAF